MGFALFEGFPVPHCHFGQEHGTMLPPSASGVSFRLKPEVGDRRIRRGGSNSDGLQRWLRYRFVYVSHATTASLRTSYADPIQTHPGVAFACLAHHVIAHGFGLSRKVKAQFYHILGIADANGTIHTHGRLDVAKRISVAVAEPSFQAVGVT